MFSITRIYEAVLVFLGRFPRRDICTVLGLLFIGRISLWLVSLAFDGSVVENLCKFDCGWYVGIAERGYQASPSSTGQGNWAFFPALPLLMAGLTALTGVDTVVAGIIVANLATMAAALIGMVYIRETRGAAGESAALVFAVLILIGPFSFYFATVYTEALLAASMIAALLAWRRGHSLAGGMAAGFASLTRLTGVVLAIVYAGRLWRRYGLTLPVVLWQRPELALAGLLAPIGFAVFALALYDAVGDAMAFARVQTAFNRSLDNPLIRLWDGLMALDLLVAVRHGNPSQTLSALIGIVGLWLVGTLVVARRFEEAFIGLFCLLLPMASSLDSIARYIIGCPVLLFAAADVLARRPWARVVPLLVMGSALNLLLVAGWYRASVQVM
ncbi:MAG: hypothetical protein AAGF76_05775 [Pseudomonadota bacterium]